MDKLCRDVANFLDAEKLERGQIFYNHNQIINISEILEEKVLLFKRIAENKKVNIIKDIEKGAHIKADPYSIDRVINNLLDNAIKYTDKDGTISVSLNKQDNKITLTVKDTGIGISEDNQKHIFEPYYQASHEKRNIQGIGMGLNIVKMIIDSLSGQIEVKSKLSQGAEFKVIFPAYEIKEGEQAQKPAEYIQPDSGIVFALPDEESYQEGRSTILLVEDNTELLYFLQNNLKNEYNIFYALNGKEALRKINDIPRPDIIISDIMMDEMDGYEFYDNIKKAGRFNDIPFIFLTAKTTQEEKMKGLEQGAVDYIYKPFSIEELTAKVKSILKTKTSQKDINMEEIKNKMLSFFNSGNDNDNKYKIFKNLCDNYSITGREEDILHQVFKGLENKEISDKLNISIETVKYHVKNIFRKCNVQNRVELVRIFSDSL